MGSWFSTESALTCGSGECVSTDAEYLESLQQMALANYGQGSKTKQECEYFGGEYTSGSSKADPRTGITSISSGRCEMPPIDSNVRKIIQKGICGPKLNPDAEWCK